jgi:hypothetical protein
MKVIGRYRKEARKCAKAKAYYGACALIGAALEGIILMFCCLRNEDVERYVAELPNNRRPPVALDRWTLGQLIAVAKALKWFPSRSSKYARTNLGDWVHLVQEVRNMIHPAMHVREYPSHKVRKGNWKDAEAIFNLAVGALASLNLESLRKSMREKGLIPLD